jgi:predicted O-methyltransferase YrrM
MKAIERTGVDYYIQVSDVELLQKIVREIQYPMPVCVNIGAGMGTSSLAMLEAREDALVYSIDIADTGEADVIREENPIYLERYIFSKGRSQDIGKTWCPRSVDFVFIDGGHSYHECYDDGLIWYDAVKPGGVMAFHDYEADMLPAIKQAVDDVTSRLGVEEIAHVGKMIVFRKGWK